jgi:hypothetical protein
MRALSVVMALVSAGFSGLLCLLFAVADSGAFCDGGVDCRTGNERIGMLLTFLLVLFFLAVTVGLLGRWRQVVVAAAVSAVVLQLICLAMEDWSIQGNGTFTAFLVATLATPWIAAITASSMRPRGE